MGLRPTKVDEDAKWRGLSVCCADTLVGAFGQEEARVEKRLDPAGKSACAISASCRVNDLEKRRHEWRSAGGWGYAAAAEYALPKFFPLFRGHVLPADAHFFAHSPPKIGAMETVASKSAK